MVGGNNAKSSSQKPPPSSSAAPTAAGSSSSNRKSRWAPSSNDGGTNGNNKINIKPISDKKLPRSNPSPKLASLPIQSHPNQTSQSSRPANFTPFPFPESSSAAIGAPPPPTYGFHMLERRNIALADGSVRSYFALPPNYQDFPPQRRLADPASNRFIGFPPFHQEDLRDHQRSHRDHQEALSMKRKYPGEEGNDHRDERGEMLRQRQHQFMQYANPNDQSLIAGGTSSPFVEDGRAVKHMRIGSSGGQAVSHFKVDQAAVKNSFLGFVKRVFEDSSERRNYLENGRKGRLLCLVCGRSFKEVQDTHGLVMHAYSSDDASLRVHHLGLHKALCVLMGWDFSKAPDNSKTYHNLPVEEATINQEQLIIWPPHIIVHNTSTGKGKDGRVEGYGNKTMDNRFRELGLTGGKSKSLYGRDGHLGVTLFKFAGDDTGLREAMRMAEYFEKTNRGRKGWARIQPVAPNKDDEKIHGLVEVDERTGDKRRVLYGYLANITDMDNIDMETKKKTTIESLRELSRSK
ncbi:unnamed protein product [Cochlearia groenlandica]